MAQIGSNDWRSVRVKADLSDLPQTLDLSPSRAGAVVILVFGAGWSAFSWPLVSQAAGQQHLALLFTLLFPLIGLAMILGGVATLFRRRKVTFLGDGVEVEGRGLRGAESWYEPYTGFRGVLHRQEVVRRKNSSTTYQIIELLHEDPARCVLLYVKPTKKVPRERWEDYARRLKLPALEASGADVVARDHKDLDKSLKDLVEEGKVTHAFDSEAPAPSGLYLERQGEDRLRIVITAARYPLWFLGIFLLAGAGMMVAAITTGEKPLLLFGVGLLFAGLPGYMLYRDRRSHRSLELDRRRLKVIDALQSDSRGRKDLALEEIEAIAVRKADGNLGRELVISSDRGAVHVGGGLSKPALAWLKDYLTAAIATA